MHSCACVYLAPDSALAEIFLVFPRNGTLLKVHTFSILEVQVADQRLLCSTCLPVLYKSNNSVYTIFLL
jgi:hypothetical protein